MTAETITPNDDVAALSDRELLERIYRRMAELEPLMPLIPRALAMLDPGAAMRGYFGRRRRDAVSEREATPVYVRPASPDSAEVGP